MKAKQKIVKNVKNFAFGRFFPIISVITKPSLKRVVTIPIEITIQANMYKLSKWSMV